MRRRTISYDSAKPSLVYAGTTEVNANSATHTHTAQPFGAPRPDRIIIVAVCFSNTSFLSSVTIGGVAATLVDRVFSTVSRRLEMWSALVPTGTSGDVVIVCDPISWVSLLSTHAAYGVLSPTAVNTATDTADPLNTTVTVNALGVVLAAGSTSSFGSTGAASWTNCTEDSEYEYSGGQTKLTTATTSVLSAGTVSPACSGLAGAVLGVTASFR